MPNDNKQEMQDLSALTNVETPLPTALAVMAHEKKNTQRKSRPAKKKDVEEARILEERCRQFCLALFFREHAPICSLGFTSSIGGEGKTFLSMVTARLLASDSSSPVVLLECNWEHPYLHEYYEFSKEPGLAEWLRHECRAADIRHQVSSNLTVIPAGNGKRDAVKLLQQMRQMGILQVFERSDELLILDLPAVMSTAYGIIAASLVESLALVVRAGVTPDALVGEACTQLKDLPVQGVILNQFESRIPRWLRQIL